MHFVFENNVGLAMLVCVNDDAHLEELKSEHQTYKVIDDEEHARLLPDARFLKFENGSVVVDASAKSAAQSTAYKMQRMSEYPSIGDQLDALFHAGVFPPVMAAQIQAIKDKYPKV